MLTLPMAFKADAQAATSTATMLVTATVLSTCTITTTPMVFGTYTGLVATSTATVVPICTVSTPYTVGLSAGVATGATVTTRAMTFATTNTLTYGLYQNASYTTNWGNTPGTDTPTSATGTGIGQTLTVYGRILAGQFPTPGAYTDTITATVNY